eukprot:TRINITY_DN3783_c0_g1_i1.p1 TRINITY_DN3783_c0_g1~~TRINITY_DN3783_c0_g1_i1.p1  ORF type:complete len:592 (+),score=173.61 TRINITY_DN3783_c0_g1_i1:70-1845(+)
MSQRKKDTKEIPNNKKGEEDKQKKETENKKENKSSTNKKNIKKDDTTSSSSLFNTSSYLSLGASILTMAAYFSPWMNTPTTGAWKFKDYPLLIEMGISPLYFTPAFISSIPIFKTLLSGRGYCVGSLAKKIFGAVVVFLSLISFVVQFLVDKTIKNLFFEKLIKVDFGSAYFILLVANLLLLLSGISILVEKEQKYVKGKHSTKKVLVSLFVMLSILGFIFFAREKYTNKCYTDASQLTLPEGFKIEKFFGIDEPRQMAYNTLSENVYVGSRLKGILHCITKDKKLFPISKSLVQPTGIALRGNDLYVSEINRILVFLDVEGMVAKAQQNQQRNFVIENLKPLIFYDKFPNDTHHGWKYLKFGPDGRLYVPVGAPCNTCLREGVYSTILRQTEIDKPEFEVFAKGIRNTVGFDWDPKSKYLWFTENGRDFHSHNWPPDEINVVTKQNQHFGFPYIYGNSVVDNEVDLPNEFSVNNFIPSAYELEPHAAALGMHFYTGKMFPSKYRNGFFVAEHGSWNSVPLRGYKVGFATLSPNKKEIESYETFVGGFVQQRGSSQIGCGRPVDVIQLNDGSILVSDDHSNQIFRIYYHEI